jgi:hypothetical protein
MSDDPDREADQPEAAPENPEAKPAAEEKVKRARRVVPTFEASMLTDPQKGLELLLRKFEKMDETALDGSRESLSLMMRTYQSWLYHLFPADFGDMCWKIADRKNVKGVVRDFVWDKKGVNRDILREARMAASDEEYAPPAPEDEPAPPPRPDFLPEADDPTPEILDLFDYNP